MSRTLLGAAAGFVIGGPVGAAVGAVGGMATEKRPRAQAPLAPPSRDDAAAAAARDDERARRRGSAADTILGPLAGEAQGITIKQLTGE